MYKRQTIHRVREVKSVVTVHDLIFLRLSHCFSLVDRLIYNYKCRYACKHAEMCIRDRSITGDNDKLPKAILQQCIKGSLQQTTLSNFQQTFWSGISPVSYTHLSSLMANLPVMNRPMEVMRCCPSSTSNRPSTVRLK